jgi:hypothetical protein
MTLRIIWKEKNNTSMTAHDHWRCMEHYISKPIAYHSNVLLIALNKKETTYFHELKINVQ